PRSQPWQGCALPTKLCPQCFLANYVSAEARVTTIPEIFSNATPRLFWRVAWCCLRAGWRFVSDMFCLLPLLSQLVD
ncbi:hypothetical protein, partial [uncultured Gardnerella sp.]|uniref:hypothetical protein n=1 Tax=uncultured Gardnerella sp. TaxID=293424 RepID=UPI002638A880